MLHYIYITMKYFAYLLLICPVFSNPVFSQSDFAKKEYFEVYDSVDLNQNNNIFNGLEYTDKYISLSVENHKFYGAFDYNEGFIKYNGQPYFDVKMKYDLLNDLIIIEYVNKKVSQLSLNSSMVEQFRLNGGEFFNIPENEVIKPFYKNGFFKLCYQDNNFSFYLKRIKDKVKKIYNKKVRYVFKEHEYYVLFYKDRCFKIDKIKDVLSAIPEYDNEVRTFYKSNKRLYNNNFYEFMKKLLNNLNKDSFN